MKHTIALTFLCAALSGCALVPNSLKPNRSSDAATATVRPEARPAVEAPTNQTITEQATADVQTPVAPPVVASGALGTTVASLGSPAEQGLWLKTPLVDAEQAGRVSYKGKTINVTLKPLDGPQTGGSRLSLQGFQALGAPLTDLVEVAVST